MNRKPLPRNNDGPPTPAPIDRELRTWTIIVAVSLSFAVIAGLALGLYIIRLVQLYVH